MGGPEPVLGETFLQARHRRPAQFDVSIAPGRQRRLLAQVFDADVVPADEAAQAIDDHYLAMVAEVHLEAIDHPAAGAERMHLHAALAQLVDIAARQRVATDAVVQQEHVDAIRRALQQQLRQALAEGVVADDEELHQHDFLCRRDGFEHRIEDALPFASRRTSLFASVGMRASPTIALSAL